MNAIDQISPKECQLHRQKCKDQIQSNTDKILDKLDVLNGSLAKTREVDIAQSKDIDSLKDSIMSLNKHLEEQSKAITNVLKQVSQGYVTRWAFNLMLGFFLTVAVGVSGYLISQIEGQATILTSLSRDIANANHEIGLAKTEIETFNNILESYGVEVKY